MPDVQAYLLEHTVLAASTCTLSKPVSVDKPYGCCADLKGLGEGKPKRSNAGMGFSRAAEHVLMMVTRISSCSGSVRSKTWTGKGI